VDDLSRLVAVHDQVARPRCGDGDVAVVVEDPLHVGPADLETSAGEHPPVAVGRRARRVGDDHPPVEAVGYERLVFRRDVAPQVDHGPAIGDPMRPRLVCFSFDGECEKGIEVGALRCRHRLKAQARQRQREHQTAGPRPAPPVATGRRCGEDRGRQQDSAEAEAEPYDHPGSLGFGGLRGAQGDIGNSQGRDHHQRPANERRPS